MEAEDLLLNRGTLEGGDVEVSTDRANWSPTEPDIMRW